jgi:hypothetical protein
MTQSELYTYARRLVNASSTDWAESDLVVDLNNALSDIYVRIQVARGVLEFDDANHSDLPVATFAVSAGTATYKITTDGSSNGILVKHKVALLKNGEYVDIPRLSVGEGNQDALISSESGFPSGYYEVGENIVFNTTPDESTTGKVFFDRNPSFYAVSGSKTAGIPAVYHSLIAEKAAMVYAVSKGKDNLPSIKYLVDKGEERIDTYETNRRGDERHALVPEVIDAT